MKSNMKDWISSDFYKIMAENFGDEIFVTNGEGEVIFVNPAAVEVIGKPVYDIIGKNVEELVKENYFKPSVTIEVLKQKKTVHMIQTLMNGKSVLATGVPIFNNDHDKIWMVISTTKDFEALSNLMQTIEDQKQEISNLREFTFESESLITASNDSELKKMILKIAPLDMPILIQGETGVGKEVTVKAIHKFGYGKDRPLVKINCATIPENLLESELFGYEQGAFTGAEKGGKKGKVELAKDGTLFLDEIGEMPLPLQVKLLDFLQDGTFSRVGGNKRLKVTTRVITATNRDLKQMCAEGSFRKDLFYRINVLPFVIPPLRERQEDIGALAKHFLSKCNSKYKRKKSLSSVAQALLKSYSWPGNIRELEHVIEHAYVVSDLDLIEDKDLSLITEQTPDEIAPQQNIHVNKFMPLKEAKREVEKQLITSAYKIYNSTYKVAEILEIDQSTVSKILKRINKEENL